MLVCTGNVPVVCTSTEQPMKHNLPYVCDYMPARYWSAGTVPVLCSLGYGNC